MPPSRASDRPFAYRGSENGRTNGGRVEDGARLMERVRARDVEASSSSTTAIIASYSASPCASRATPRSPRTSPKRSFSSSGARPRTFREGNFSGWLSRVTRNRALDVVRSRANRPTGEIPADVAAEASTDGTVFARIDAQRVRSALSALSEEQRAPIEMGFFAGITHEEIAQRTGIPLGTIKTRIRTGLRRMREMLTEAVSR